MWFDKIGNRVHHPHPLPGKPADEKFGTNMVRSTRQGPHVVCHETTTSWEKVAVMDSGPEL